MYNQIKLKYPHTEILVVSKQKSIEQIKYFYDKGIYNFGENRANELIFKASHFPLANWHFIGHLQRKKVKSIIQYVDIIESVDSKKLLIEINKQAEKISKVQKVFLQLNLTKDENKTGLNKLDFIELLSYSKALNNITVCGVMAMGPNTDNLTEIKTVFNEVSKLYFTYKHKNNLQYLSMGMSNDYDIAAEYGANQFRLGTILFK